MGATLSSAEKKELLAIARESIETKLDGKRYELPKAISPGLKQKLACFVTLNGAGGLRGCIGHLEAVMPLAEGIAENARAAAFGDPRFPPVGGKEELEGIKIEISVLTEPKPFPLGKVPAGLKGKGVIAVFPRGNRSTLLPQVWEEVPDPGEFVSILCAKAGEPPGAWKKARFFAYGAEHFSE